MYSQLTFSKTCEKRRIFWLQNSMQKLDFAPQVNFSMNKR